MKTFAAFLFSFAVALTCLLPTRAQDTRVASIRQVDFRNFTYTGSACRNSVTVRGGKYKQGAAYFSVEKIVYGDLTNDGAEQAAIWTYCEEGPPSRASEVFIYAMRNGAPVLLTQLDPGHGAFGGITDVRIVRGLLKVKRLFSNTTASHPQRVFIETYRLKGNRLIRTRAASRKILSRHLSSC